MLNKILESELWHKVPGYKYPVQRAIDSTSYTSFLECPYKYALFLHQGLRPNRTSVHLTFGLLYHAALERFRISTMAGKSYTDAQADMLRWTLANCQGLQRTEDNFIFERHSNKNVDSLIRSILWYTWQYEHHEDKTLQLANGKPAVEFSFKIDLPRKLPESSEAYMIAGHIDEVYSNDVGVIPKDKKTSTNALDDKFFSEFKTSPQFKFYTIASKILFNVASPGLEVEGAQIGARFTRFKNGLVPQTPEKLEEFLSDFLYTIGEMERCAKSGHYPRRETSCNHYGGCQYRPICSRDPSIHESIIKTNFRVEAWNPLKSR